MTFALCVFCGSRPGNDPRITEDARALGTELARRGGRLIYGAGSQGVMGVVSNACLEAGGEVVGVIPGGLFAREVGHQGLTELVVTETMHERKHTMHERADAFLALPGGAGTLEELLEALCWSQIGLHQKPVGVLDTGGFYDHLVLHLKATVEAGFIEATDFARLQVAQTPNEALDQLGLPVS